MPVLVGENIILREYRAEDIHPIRRWMNDAETTRYLSTRFWAPLTSVDAEEYLSARLNGSHNSCQFVIASKEDGRYIGQCDLFRLDWRLRLGEMGMLIADKAERGKGIGREALGLMQAYAFDTLGLERLELEVHMDNQSALACYRRAGFVLEGVKRRAFFSQGRFCDVGMMSVLREEYLAHRRA